MTLQVNPMLAKLLAKENLEVRHGNYSTAWFDPANRVLGLPIWEDHGKDVYDLLVGHEVGHALFTPADGWHDSNQEIKGCPRSYLNVIEDVRIERKIRNTYPGLISPMRRGYKVLIEKGFFGNAEEYNFDAMKLIDKINLKSKLSTEIEVPFNAKEQVLFDRALVAETWSEVVQIVRDILAYQKENQTELMSNKAPSKNDEDESGDEGTKSQTQSNTPEEDEDPTQSGHDDQEEGDNPSEEEDDEEEKSTMSSQPKYNPEEEVSVTDEIFRSKESSLIDQGTNGSQPIFVNELSKETREKCIVPYAMLAADRARVQNVASDSTDTFRAKESRHLYRAKYKSYFKGVKKAVIPAVKEFEMRKAAYQYQRSSTAKTGSLDVNKVHGYKFNDDIFARVTKEANAKNHGMFLLIDFSGSMYKSMPSVLDQVCHLVAFCKSVNIPFAVYGFTTGKEDSSIYDMKKSDMHGALDLDELSLFELTSSKLKKVQFEESMYQIFLRRYHGDLRNGPYGTYGQLFNAGFCGDKEFISKYEEYGSTPLHQALIISHYLVKDFINSHNVEKMNFVTLTDGDSNRVTVYRQHGMDNHTSTDRRYYQMPIDKKLVKFHHSEVCKSILENMSKQLGTNNIGFFIAEDARNMGYRHQHAFDDNSKLNRWDWQAKDMNKEFRDNRCLHVSDTLGYDDYYILKDGRSNLSTDTEEFDATADDSKGKVTTQFKKYSKSKKTNKVLMTKLGKAVA